ncbi:MAG: sugar transferase [Patescibacteria group bacterium]|nr:sugar transferase [Patescibacteria group bacterium]
MPNIKRLFLVFGDIAVLYLSLWLALFVRYGANFDFHRWQQHFWPFTIVYLLWLTVFYISGLYELTLARNNIDFYSFLLRSLLINIGLAIAFFYFIPYFGITPKTNLFLNLAIFALLFASWRQLYNHSIKSSALVNNVLIIGKNKEIDQAIEVVKNNPQLGYRIIKRISPKNIQTPFDILEIAAQKSIKTIITAIDPHQDSRLVRSLYQCLPLKISFSDLPSFYEKILGKVPVSSIGEIWFLENLTESQKNFYEALKRIVDMVGAFIFGVISLFLYPFIALAIKIDSHGSVFYKQRRIGQDGQIFKVIKFRSMIEEAEKDGAQWADQQDHRITRVGRFMRKTRIDELPQLWNVLIGQMSFIGPRPERIEFAQRLEKEIPYYQIRHIIRPGLTGWAQVNFRYGASVKDSIEKLQYELYYIKRRSLVLDISILLRTIKIILGGLGR